MNRKTLAIALGAALSASLAATAQADKLDDIIESGKLRCAVTLDFPPLPELPYQGRPRPSAGSERRQRRLDAGTPVHSRE